MLSNVEFIILLILELELGLVRFRLRNVDKNVRGTVTRSESLDFNFDSKTILYNGMRSENSKGCCGVSSKESSGKTSEKAETFRLLARFLNRDERLSEVAGLERLELFLSFLRIATVLELRVRVLRVGLKTV